MEEVKKVANKEKIIEVAGLDEKIGRISDGFFLVQEFGTSTKDGLNKEIHLQLGMSGCPIVGYGRKSFILEWHDILALAELAGLFEDEEETSK